MSTMTLAQIQREMARAVMMPLTSDEDMRRESPDGRQMEQVAASFIAPNSKLSSLRSPGDLQPAILVSGALVLLPKIFPRCDRSSAHAHLKRCALLTLANIPADHSRSGISVRTLQSGSQETRISLVVAHAWPRM